MTNTTAAAQEVCVVEGDGAGEIADAEDKGKREESGSS